MKTRHSTGDITKKGNSEHSCNGILHKASTGLIDTKVREYATVWITELKDSKLPAKLASSEDMVAVDAMYHTKCIAAFYNRAQQLYSKNRDNQEENSRLHAVAIAELVSCIEEFRA